MELKKENSLIGIYIHVPFCEKKCPYCDFYSVNNNESMMDIYTDAVCLSIKNWSTKIKKEVDTIYFGGGTPSLIGEIRLSKIIKTISKYFVLKNPEITIEINPTKGKLLDFYYLKESGINRLSVGLQSIHKNELKILGRSHDNNDAKTLISSAQKAGINNISLDLMIAIPLQTNQSLKSSIEFCKSSGVPHISAYMLKIEPGTPFYKCKSNLKLPNEESAVSLYFQACEELEKYGYKQYEISNFSVPKMESKHNLKYWNCDEYLGIGPSAHSFIDKNRFYYSRDINTFIKENKIILDGHGGDETEYSMLRLRLTKGLENNEFKKKFSYDIPQLYYKKAAKYESMGLVICTDNSIKLTRKGFLVSNELISEIIL